MNIKVLPWRVLAEISIPAGCISAKNLAYPGTRHQKLPEI
jgi:hypothetical protein